jgi:hypothetical protein
MYRYSSLRGWDLPLSPLLFILIIDVIQGAREDRSNGPRGWNPARFCESRQASRKRASCMQLE